MADAPCFKLLLHRSCCWLCCVCRAELGLDGELLRKVVSKGGVTKYPLQTLQVGLSRAERAGGLGGLVFVCLFHPLCSVSG
jgi:hypothetical protein